VTSTIGLAILAKLGFVALLFVIFKTCPMWRACSPIDGVCDLEDLDRGSSDGSPESPDEPPAEGLPMTDLEVPDHVSNVEPDGRSTTADAGVPTASRASSGRLPTCPTTPFW